MSRIAVYLPIMTTNDKNRLIAIKQRLTLLPEPINYYAGTGDVTFVEPENVLVLGRYSGHLPSITNKMHHRFLLAVMLAGSGSAVVDNVRYVLREGYCFVIFPHQYHRFFADSDDIRWIFITFKMKRTDHIERLRNASVAITDQSLLWLDELTKTFADNRRDHVDWPQRATLLTGLLLCELMHSETLFEKCRPETFVDKVNRYIDANIHTPLKPGDIANHFSYSPSRLRAIYLRDMGISIGRYIRKLRLTRAQRMLGTTDMDITSIARSCGYDSIYSFSRAFRCHCNLSPTRYRKLSQSRM